MLPGLGVDCGLDYRSWTQWVTASGCGFCGWTPGWESGFRLTPWMFPVGHRWKGCGRAGHALPVAGTPELRMKPNGLVHFRSLVMLWLAFHWPQEGMKPSPASIEQRHILAHSGRENEWVLLNNNPNNGSSAAQSQEELAFTVMQRRLLFSPLPVCKAGKWCMDLINGAQSHLNSSEISSFQRCHLPLTRLHCKLWSSSSFWEVTGRRQGGVGGRCPSSFWGKSFHLVPGLSSRSYAWCLPRPGSCLVPFLFSLSSFVFSLLLLQYPGIFKWLPLLHQALSMMLEKQWERAWNDPHFCRVYF